MGRLKGIPTILSPDLLYTLASMGHGDEIVLADANFPSASVCKSGAKLINADGHPIPELLKAILHLLPLDGHVEKPFALMDLVPGDEKVDTKIWETYYDLVNAAEPGRTIHPDIMERFKFYERAKKAFAVVHTGETALYANIILKKGIVKPEEIKEEATVLKNEEKELKKTKSSKKK